MIEVNENKNSRRRPTRSASALAVLRPSQQVRGVLSRAVDPRRAIGAVGLNDRIAAEYPLREDR